MISSESCWVSILRTVNKRSKNNVWRLGKVWAGNKRLEASRLPVPFYVCPRQPSREDLEGWINSHHMLILVHRPHSPSPFISLNQGPILWTLQNSDFLSDDGDDDDTDHKGKDNNSKDNPNKDRFFVLVLFSVHFERLSCLPYVAYSKLD